MQILKEKDQEYRDGDHGVKYLFKGPEIEWGIILLKSGQSLTCHYHNKVEETFYILEGNPTIIVDGKEYSTEVQTAYRIPAPEKHNLTNKNSIPAKILFIKAPFDPKDKVDC